jgi:hypothetical protein
MKRNTFTFVVLVVGLSLLFGCSTPTRNIPGNSTRPVEENQVLFADEFNSLNTDVWSSLPSLTPFPGLEGSKTPGEIKAENGILKLSRYAPELYGENQASFIQTKNTVDLSKSFSATMRFKNEFTAFGFGDLFVEIFHHTITIGRRGFNGGADDTYEYPYNDNSFFVLSLDITRGGYTIRIKEDTADAVEKTFSQNVDLSEFLCNSTITIGGGSNIQAAQYSEVDYIRINRQ